VLDSVLSCPLLLGLSRYPIVEDVMFDSVIVNYLEMSPKSKTEEIEKILREYIKKREAAGDKFSKSTDSVVCASCRPSICSCLRFSYWFFSALPQHGRSPL
jgi:hypothetical protein